MAPKSRKADFDFNPVLAFITKKDDTEPAQEEGTMPVADQPLESASSAQVQPRPVSPEPEQSTLGLSMPAQAQTAFSEPERSPSESPARNQGAPVSYAPIQHFPTSSAARTSPARVSRSREETNRLKGACNIIGPNGERRTRRVQVLVRPSLYEKVARELRASGKSFASLIDDLLSEYMGESK